MVFKSTLLQDLSLGVQIFEASFIKEVALNSISPTLEGVLNNEYNRGLWVGFDTALQMVGLKNAVNLEPSRN